MWRGFEAGKEVHSGEKPSAASQAVKQSSRTLRPYTQSIEVQNATKAPKSKRVIKLFGQTHRKRNKCPSKALARKR
jgi:hypothetical protein